MRRSLWDALLRALMVPAVLATGACSTVIEGTDQSVMISTEPQGSKCILWRDGKRVGEVGQTPASIIVSKSKDDITVKCSGDGYQETTATLTSGGSGWSFGNVVFGLLGGGIGLIVDAASGAMTKYPDSLQVNMVPASFATEEQRDRFFDALVARHDAEFQKTSQVIENQCRAGGAELCGMKIKKLEELHREALAVVERQRQAAVVEDPKHSQNQTIKPDLTKTRKADSSDQPVVAALPPVKSRQEVEAYLNQNRSGFQRELSSYNRRHRVLVGDYGLTEVVRISSREIKRLDGEFVVLEVGFEVGQPGYRTAGCGVFELRWVGAQLEFVGDRGECT